MSSASLALLKTPPTVVLSDLLGALKSKSASGVLDRFGPVYWGKPARTSFELECIDRLPEPLTDDPVPFRFWPNGFFLRSVGGATLEILKSYIETRAANSP